MTPNMDVRRLVRALGLGALVLTLLGYGIGLAAADSATDGEAVAIPRPGPGDRALYQLVELDAGGAVREHGISADITVEWLDARDAIAPDLTMRPAHVLGVTYRSERYEDAADVAWDAATGLPLSAGRLWANPYSYATLPMPDGVTVGPQPEAEGSLDGRSDALHPATALCGMRADVQGRAVQEGETVTVFGSCDAEGKARATPFKVRGWKDSGDRRVLRLEAGEGDLRQRVDYDPALPFPVRVEGKFPGFVYAGYAEGKTFALVLEAYHPGHASYPVPASVGGLAAEPAFSLRPLTGWTIDDSGVHHEFPLSQAYAAALDDANYPWGDETLREFMQRHPDAYLAFAWSFHTEDARGTSYPIWALTWTDGSAQFSKAVSQYPDLLLADSGALPREATVSEWPMEWPEDFFGPASRLPAALPDVAQVWDASRPLLADSVGAEPNSYGFMVVCPGEDCLEATALVHAGYSWMPAAPFGVGLTDSLQDQRSVFSFVGADQDGRPSVTLMLTGQQKAPVPLLPPTEAPPRSAPASGDGGAAPVTAWAIPAAPAVAGVGLVATLVGALYYFWPAVKAGGLGLFSRIEPDRVLDHPARRTVFNLVEANPGIHFQEIGRRTAFGSGQLDHHLRKLEAAGLVSRVKGAQYACFFARGQVDRRLMAAAPALRSEGGRSVLTALQSTPGASSRDLADRLRLSPGTVSYHVRRLGDAGLLVSTGGALRLTDLGQQAAAA